MIEFSPQNLQHFCPFFIQIAQMGLILSRWGLILPRIPPPTHVLYSAVTHPFLGYIRTQNTPKPTPKLPFSWPELESWQNELPLDPKYAKCLISGQNFSRSGQKKFISRMYMNRQPRKLIPSSSILSLVSFTTNVPIFQLCCATAWS